MEISSIKSSAFYGYTATDSNATITGTFTTSTLPVIEVDGMYVTTNILSTVTTYTETTLTEYTSYTSTSSWSETASSFSSTGRITSSSQASHLGETYNDWSGTTQLTLYKPYYSKTASQIGYNTISTIGYTGTTEVNGTDLVTLESSSVFSTSRIETTSNSITDTESGTNFSSYHVYSSGQFSAMYTLSYVSGSRFRATQFLFSRDIVVTTAAISSIYVTSKQSTLNDAFSTYAVDYYNSTLNSTVTSLRTTSKGYTLLYNGRFDSASVTN